ncbi:MULTISPECIES: ABC transporter permease [Mycobacterium]|uniref:ABC transporter permease n=1 Tax=Mycobacterium kiyosense TaxID=2871094 RepID=A0A9P3Q3M1_9MYCO|nr:MULTISPECIES: ABC transporter permease [Mycobacterium]BDB44332.1 ABC transporter permease [Mycobacterium kiyosense]BDE15856.1 ABC transporter permease [Mycobacterium sp. 20KCMC460]GLB80750.1 ABC transporter permease [Mycobacterium kiyosense]GLB87512.1 ABC transporter permease [Mycobacterium kiyosense]GLB93230.1 ABC transporter permease [Mycobacterium kiyosense]
MSSETVTVVRARFPRLARSARNVVAHWDRLGEQTAFYIKAFASMRDAIVKYHSETLRVLAEMGLGVGALALVGGEVVILAVLTGSAAAIIGIFGYVQASSLGVGAIAGFFSAYANVRLQLPLIVANGLAATIGAGATAQLGAMRISEEIDALEVIGIRSIPYLVSTRVLGGLMVVPPLFCVTFVGSVFTTRTVVTLAYHQGAGGFDHYFYTFLLPRDVLVSLFECTVQAVIVMLIHTYYGYTASGGPAGVGEAVGRAVRASIVVSITLTFVLSLLLYGKSGDFHLSG